MHGQRRFSTFPVGLITPTIRLPLRQFSAKIVGFYHMFSKDSPAGRVQLNFTVRKISTRGKRTRKMPHTSRWSIPVLQCSFPTFLFESLHKDLGDKKAYIDATPPNELFSPATHFVFGLSGSHRVYSEARSSRVGTESWISRGNTWLLRLYSWALSWKGASSREPIRSSPAESWPVSCANQESSVYSVPMLPSIPVLQLPNRPGWVKAKCSSTMRIFFG